MDTKRWIEFKTIENAVKLAKLTRLLNAHKADAALCKAEIKKVVIDVNAVIQAVAHRMGKEWEFIEALIPTTQFVLDQLLFEDKEEHPLIARNKQLFAAIVEHKLFVGELREEVLLLSHCVYLYHNVQVQFSLNIKDTCRRCKKGIINEVVVFGARFCSKDCSGKYFVVKE